MALSKSEVLALIPAPIPPYVSPYQEYTAVLYSDGTNIGMTAFLINQTGDSSQDGTNDILWSITGANTFSGVQTSSPFITSLTDTKPLTILDDSGKLFFAVPSFTSTSQIDYTLYYGDWSIPTTFPVFTANNVLLTIRVFI